MSENLVLAMAICAGGSIQNPFHHGLPVDTLTVILCDGSMAASAGGFDVPFVHTRCIVIAFQHVVAAVAIAARGCRFVPGRHRFPVNAPLVRFDERSR